MPRSRRDGRLLIVALWFDPHGTAGAGLADKREFPKGRPSAFREVARRIPPSAPSGQHPPGARASRPHAVPWVAAQFPCDVAARPSCRGNRMGPAEAEPWRRCRSIRVEEMGEAIPGFVRAGRPRSRGPFSHDVVTPTSQYCRSIRAPLAGKVRHPLLRVGPCSRQAVMIRSFILEGSYDPPGTAEAGFAWRGRE